MPKLKGELEIASGSNVPAGLEDFDSEADSTLPRLQIDHQEGVYRDTQSGEEYEALTVVALGMVKSRILWPPDISEDKSSPLCKSVNFREGLPGENFPWKAAKFNPADWDDDAVLPCSDCALKEWGTHPKQEVPWCAEQWNFILLQPIEEGAELDDPTLWTPALLTLQRSGLKNARSYVDGFNRKRQSMFTTVTKISGTHNKRGTVRYLVPTFSRVEATPVELHDFYESVFRRLAPVLRTPRDRGGNSEETTAVGAKSAAADGDTDIDFSDEEI